MTRHHKTDHGRSRKRRPRPHPRNVLVYAGAVGLFAVAGHQCYHDKQEAAAATLVTGLGLLGVGAQAGAGVKIAEELTGHVLDIRNNPAMPGTPYVPPIVEPPPGPTIPPAG